MAGTRAGALKAWRTMRTPEWKRHNAAVKAHATRRKLAKRGE
jgi:hypothetical protein